MARVFLDANYYIDLTKRAKEKWESLDNDLLFISAISTHILFYARKLKVPDQEIEEVQQRFGIVSLTKELIDKALTGPTKDLEDNIQLLSAVDADCDYFLTSDKNLLNLGIFGKTRIVASLS